MTQTEALTLALEALETERENYQDWDKEDGAPEYIYEAITAMKELLAQPEQEPAKYTGTYGTNGFYLNLPVAVVDVHEFYDNCANFSLLQKLPKGKHTLYTTPPQRTWVGLTEEDLKLLSAEWRIVYGAWMDDFARDIEAKLKEKNC